MRKILLALICAAAAVLPVTSAAAGADGGLDLTASTPSVASVRIHRGNDGPRWGEGRVMRESRRDRRRDHLRGRDMYVPNYYGGEWALYNNRGWEADSYNDWWHERPARAVPRWVRRNGNCAREYWSGGGWTC